MRLIIACRPVWPSRQFLVWAMRASLNEVVVSRPDLTWRTDDRTCLIQLRPPSVFERGGREGVLWTVSPTKSRWWMGQCLVSVSEIDTWRSPWSSTVVIQGVLWEVRQSSHWTPTDLERWWPVNVDDDHRPAVGTLGPGIRITGSLEISLSFLVSGSMIKVNIAERLNEWCACARWHSHVTDAAPRDRLSANRMHGSHGVEWKALDNGDGTRTLEWDEIDERPRRLSNLSVSRDDTVTRMWRWRDVYDYLNVFKPSPWALPPSHPRMRQSVYDWSHDLCCPGPSEIYLPL